jgi:hypothetical protein
MASWGGFNVVFLHLFIFMNKQLQRQQQYSKSCTLSSNHHQLQPRFENGSAGCVLLLSLVRVPPDCGANQVNNLSSSSSSSSSSHYSFVFVAGTATSSADLHGSGGRCWQIGGLVDGPAGLNRQRAHAGRRCTGCLTGSQVASWAVQGSPSACHTGQAGFVVPFLQV